MAAISSKAANRMDNKYEYNSKEKQEKEFSDGSGLHWYDFSARTYDPQIGRWNQLDPLGHKFSWQSAFVAMDNNPILKNDPTGLAAASAIYNVNGNLLGTDDQGLQGKPIIMKEENFTQGMSHQEAMKHDLAPNGGAQYQEVISDHANYAKFYQHYTNLPNRPDYDGYLTKEEADEWWQHGNGEPLYVDRSKIVLDPVTTSWFQNKKSTTHNFLIYWGKPEGYMEILV